MANAAASSSAGPSPKPKANGKGKKPALRVKTNQAKRNRVETELKELKRRIEEYEPPAELETFSQLPLSVPTLKGEVVVLQC